MKYDKHTCNDVCGCGNQADAQRIAIEIARLAIHKGNKGKDVNCAVMLMAIKEHFELLVRDMMVGRMALSLMEEPSLGLAASISGKKAKDIALEITIPEHTNAVQTMQLMVLSSLHDNELANKRRAEFVCEELGDDTFKDFFEEGPSKRALQKAGVVFEGDDKADNFTVADLIALLASGRKPN